MTDRVVQRLSELGLTLPQAMAPVASYAPYLRSENMLFISGQISKTGDGTLILGHLGQDLDIEQGQKAAQACGLNILAQAAEALGSLERIAQVVRLTGFVNATADFKDHPQVINGASDLMVAALGDKGRHTRSAVGVSGLPLGCAVEIDAILKFD